MKELIEKINAEIENFQKDATAQLEKGNKAAGTRARKASLVREKGTGPMGPVPFLLLAVHRSISIMMPVRLSGFHSHSLSFWILEHSRWFMLEISSPGLR